MMNHTHISHFQNDKGYSRIKIGVKKFMCAGASPPLDHPHIFINMGEENEKHCPYCATLYCFDDSLGSEKTFPAGCFLSVR
ncbi:MAG: zinc-finger domain-containing protein [Candidatus Liberibacter europaeus]|uniref:Zinc-finger domain-containing protein n=1 Tax=Candidatus Liberibacter europaeus TaxID=744859 RepID=A0A2T4VX64_9HYPH|nr:zinc-finger domain-containing protein [Candidatus Liberibacter europaeus]PTL86364.1 MAG: zinc-finger domain-containing protein [Candidatus Liberibacter europaeus]